MTYSKDNSEFVYSTENGRMCSSCGKPIKKCICSEKAKKAVALGEGIVRVSRETKGRKGKGVTIITGVPLPTEKLKDLGKKLKKKCGCGGTLKNGKIEIQGEHRDFLVDELKKQGFTVKKSGG